MGIKISFYVILYIIIFIRIALESLGIVVSNDFIFLFYIFVYLGNQFIVYHCRSPPVDTNFWNLYWLEVFLWKILF